MFILDKRTIVLAALSIFAVSSSPLYAQIELTRLNPNDPVYVQHQRMIAEYHTANAQDGPLPPLLLMTYAPTEDETLFDIASKLMLPYATIASINRLDSAEIPAHTSLLIPSRPGLYIFDQPVNPIEQAVKRRLESFEHTIAVRLPGINERVLHAPGTDFSPGEREIFLRVVFSDPLPGTAISSYYGFRPHPMTGRMSFHHGIDLVANFGEPVLAAAPGTVAAIGRDPWLGLWVAIDHPGEFQTRYAHLQEVLVETGTFVERGVTIGAVGSTGLSTGSHLHFEIRKHGESVDPVRYLERD